MPELWLDVNENPFVEHRRSILPDDRDLRLLSELRADRLRFNPNDPLPRMDRSSGRHRRDEAQLIRSIVDHIAKAADLPSRIKLERGQQAQGQKAMRHRSAERTFTLAALDVQMNPLMVAGDICELLNLVLGNLDRVAPRAKFITDFSAQLLQIIETYICHLISPD